MNWQRALTYLAFAAGVIVITFMIAAGLAIGDCALEVENCGVGRRIALFVVLGLGLLALAYLIFRYLRGASRRR